MSNLPPDLQQNLIHTLYALFIHNYIVFAYFFGFLLSVIISIIRPSRFSILLLLGFAILTFSFEYDKHIIEGFRQQTLQSLITEKPHYRLERLIDLIISEILPIIFYLLGWGLIYLALFLEGIKKKKDKKD